MIYGKYAQTAGQMGVRDLLDFLLNEQRDQVSMEDALRLIQKYELDETGKTSLDGFNLTTITNTNQHSRADYS